MEQTSSEINQVIIELEIYQDMIKYFNLFLYQFPNCLFLTKRLFLIPDTAFPSLRNYVTISFSRDLRSYLLGDVPLDGHDNVSYIKPKVMLQ